MIEDFTKMLIDLQKSIGEIDKNQAVAAEKLDQVKNDVAAVKDDIKQIDIKVDSVDTRLAVLENRRTLEDQIVRVSKWAWGNKVVRYVSVALMIIGLNAGLSYFSLPSIDLKTVLSFVI